MSISRIEHDESDDCSSNTERQNEQCCNSGTATVISLQGKVPSQPPSIPSWRVWLSRLAAAVMLAVSSPLIVVSYLLVRITSRGPGFYRQTRLGLNATQFEVIKLRSMYIDAESRTGPVWAKKNDPRITPVGHWLRVLHLDELPQLFNVLRGEMALVGPRPERPEIAETLGESLPDFPQRLAVRPGITGLAQINLPANSDLESARSKLSVDLQYVESSNLWLDIRIIAATAPRLVGCRGRLIRFINRLCGVARVVRPERDRSANGEELPSPPVNGDNGHQRPPTVKAFEWAAPANAQSAGSGTQPRKDRLKLAYVTHLPITQWLFLKGQNTFMRESGFELHAISSPGHRLEMLAARDDLTTHEVPIARSISPWRDFVSLIRIVRVLRRVRPDVLHLSTPKAALLGAVAARLTGVPVTVFLVRGFTSAQSQGVTRYIFQKLERLTASLATSVLCNAPSLLDYGRQNKILKPTQGSVLVNGMSNGIDLENFGKHSVASNGSHDRSRNNGDGADGPVIGFVGRLADDKGIEVLAESWKVIRDEFPASQLMLVGPWETRDTVSQITREFLETDQRVTITGAVDDVRPYLQKMDLFAFPSFGEGFPNAPMEAAAFEIPVISTTAVGCVDSIEDGVTGTLIPPRDVDSLTVAIRTYLSDSELRAKHGRAGRARLESDFRRKPIWEALLEHYHQHLEQHYGVPVVSVDRTERKSVNSELGYSTVSSLGE